MTSAASHPITTTATTGWPAKRYWTKFQFSPVMSIVRGELLPQQAAATYQAELEAILGPDGRLDLILLSRGTDGHTASLFPGTRALEEREQSVVAVYVGEPHGEEGEVYVWQEGDGYRKVRVLDNKLVGALLLGERHGSMALFKAIGRPVTEFGADVVRSDFPWNDLALQNWDYLFY